MHSLMHILMLFAAGHSVDYAHFSAEILRGFKKKIKNQEQCVNKIIKIGLKNSHNLEACEMLYCI